MGILDRYRTRILDFLEISILIFVYIYALGLFTSKSLISIGLGISCILWFIKAILEKNYNFCKTKLDFAIIIFIVGLLFSLFDFWGEVVFGRSKFMIAILFYYVVVNSIKKIKHVKSLSYTVLVSASFASIYGLYQHYYLNASRVDGFSFPLSFGGMLAIIMMFTIGYIMSSKTNNKNKIILSGLTLLFGVNLLFTKSRGAWLGFLSAIPILTWLRDKRLVIGFSVLLIIVAFLLPNVYINRFKSSFNVTDNRSNLARIALWKGSLLMLKDHPINGVGLGNFMNEYEAHYRQPHTTTTVHAHNNFLQFAAETGLVGLSAFIFLMYKVLKVLYLGWKKIKGKWSLYLQGAFFSVIVFNVQGLTEFNFGDTEPLNLFWFMLALCMVVLNNFEEN